jgi:hypothetical protein
VEELVFHTIENEGIFVSDYQNLSKNNWIKCTCHSKNITNKKLDGE